MPFTCRLYGSLCTRTPWSDLHQNWAFVDLNLVLMLGIHRPWMAFICQVLREQLARLYRMVEEPDWEII